MSGWGVFSRIPNADHQTVRFAPGANGPSVQCDPVPPAVGYPDAMVRKLYRVTGRARACVIFRAGDTISANYTRESVTGRVVFSTRYINAGLAVPVPGDLQVVIEAEADTVDVAATWVTAGRELASVISLAANAAIAPLQAELVYDITPGKREREFFQRFEPSDQPTLSSRTVPIEESISLLSAIGPHEDRDRLLRAITQYTEAISHLSIGNELLVVAQLWMGIEAITPAYLRKYLKERGVTKEKLGAEWGYDPTRRMSLDQALNAAAKVNLTFQGDELHYKIAKDVSDSFEHGLKNGGRLFAPARDAMVPTAAYLREAVLKLAGLSETQRRVLLSEPYNRPRGLGGPEQYLRASLVGESEQLAADGFDHPCVEWENKVKEATLQGGTWTYGIDHQFTVRVGKGIQFSGPNLEVWDGGIYMPKSAAQRKGEDQIANDQDSMPNSGATCSDTEG